MADFTTLDALQLFHRDIIALRDKRADSVESLAIPEVVTIYEKELGKIWNRPAKSEQARTDVKNGKVTVDDEEFSINEDFRSAVLALSDEADINEIEAMKCLLDAQQDFVTGDRSLLECGVIRLHQQQKYTLDVTRLLLELDSFDADDELEESGLLEPLRDFVNSFILPSSSPSSLGSSLAPKRITRSCLDAMRDARLWLQRVSDKLTAASMLNTSKPDMRSGEMQKIEFSRISLIQQHELIATILVRLIEKKQSNEADFKEFLEILEKSDKYDVFLIHLIPALGAFISAVGSSESLDLKTARKFHPAICPDSEHSKPWSLPYLQAAVRAWWLAEYSGHYLDDPPESAIEPGVNLDEEDRQRSKQFLEALRDGAFDFLLSIAADIKSIEWQDPARMGMRQWLQRKAPPLPQDAVAFSDFFHTALMLQMEVFIDGFISNLPDVLRKLRVEEDEQRQLSQTHEHDLDLERFLIIIAYSYEGRPDAALNFWSDPDSNLAGFMHWASRRASTPLVTAFSEMLQAISENEVCATAAHEFLLDEGHHSSGKMRRTQSLTWSQIIKELVFFSNKIREKPAPAQSLMYRSRPSSDQAEAEPESAMMLECYLRLMTKLATESESARQFLLRETSTNIVDTLFQLASSQIPPRLRACTFMTLQAFLARKSIEEGHNMWLDLDSWMTGTFVVNAAGLHRSNQLSPLASMDRVFAEIGNGFEEPYSFIRLLTALIVPSQENGPLNDSLPFPENLGSSFRMSGIEMYVDFAIGHVFGSKSTEVRDTNQLRMLRLSCLEFTLTCLATFNEDLIVLANTTNISLDTAIAVTDLSTYVRLHPFARVMEWMFNDKVMTALFNTVNQDAVEVANAAPDSPLILGILRAVEVITKVLELQDTYLELVRPLIKLNSNNRSPTVANAAYASFEDGLVTRLHLVSDLGNYCGIGHADLTLACLRLLREISASPKIASLWSSGQGRHGTRNKAIVALESNGEHEPIAQSLVSELTAPLDPGAEGESPTYWIKIAILDFVYSCLKESPYKPTIAHLLLGFKCGIDDLSVESDGAFETQTSLFHTLIRILIETPSSGPMGIQGWMIKLRYKAMLILRSLWSSPLSAPIVIQELRDNEIFFHLLIHGDVIQPDLLWEGEVATSMHFPVTSGASALVEFLTLRAITLEYMAIELCSISQNRLPSLKRRVFEALSGQISTEENTNISVSSIFDLFDFVMPSGAWEIPSPQLVFFNDLNVNVCLENDGANGIQLYNIDLAREILLLKQGESQADGAIVASQDIAIIDREQEVVLEYLTALNRKAQLEKEVLKVLAAWTKLLLVMIESNDFKGTVRTSFFLQALQAILPSLETFSIECPSEAIELAKLARVLLFKLDLSSPTSSDDRESQSIGNLVSEKLYQLFHICIAAISKWAGDPELRAVYYSICFRFLTGLAGEGPLVSARPKTMHAIHVYGERLFNVVCDDASDGELACQTAALILLGALVNTGAYEHDGHVVETLNKLNFIGVLVDSLKNVLQEWIDLVASGNVEQEHYQNAKLALLLQLSQTRDGAKHVLHANLFRALHQSGLFVADPELQIDPTNPKALTHHYGLLAKVTRIISAAILSRGSHNIVQGRRFLTDHRMLVTHTLKRAAGIGAVQGNELEEKVEELADAFLVIITATEFLEFEEESVSQQHQQMNNGTAAFFH